MISTTFISCHNVLNWNNMKHQSSNYNASIGIAERNETIIFTLVPQEKEFESSECQFFLDAVTIVA